MAGLWVASVLWLGGAGPLGLGILRLAGIYAMYDLISIIVAPLHMVGWLITISLYVVMLAWLFDFDIRDSIAVALITFLLKFFAGVMIFSLIMGFGLPDDNLHAPNEKQHIPTFYRGIETYIHYLFEAAEE